MNGLSRQQLAIFFKTYKLAKHKIFNIQVNCNDLPTKRIFREGAFLKTPRDVTNLTRKGVPNTPFTLRAFRPSRSILFQLDNVHAPLKSKIPPISQVLCCIESDIPGANEQPKTKDHLCLSYGFLEAIPFRVPWFLENMQLVPKPRLAKKNEIVPGIHTIKWMSA